MKEEKENQKKKEEKINLKEAKEKKVSKKAVKTKDEATDNKEVKKVAKKEPAKKATKKSTKKASRKEASNVEKVEDKETSKMTEVNNAKLDESIAKLTNKNIDEIKEEIQNAVKSEETESNTSTKDEKKPTSIQDEIDDREEIIINEPEEKSDNQKRKEKREEESELIEKQKKRRSSIIMSSVIAALILIIVIVAIIIGNLNTTKTENHNFYQWYFGQKVEYNGQLTFTRKEGLTELKATDRKVTLDSTPVYYADEKDKVIFPEDMAIVYPTNNGLMYRVNHFSDVVKEDGDIYLESNLATSTSKDKIEKAFLYDGQDLYFFLERTNLIVNGTTYELSPLSYVIVRYKQNVQIYDYDKDEFKIIETKDTQDAKVVTDLYTIDLSVDSLKTAEKEQLLIKGLDYLTPFKNEK